MQCDFEWEIVLASHDGSQSDKRNLGTYVPHKKNMIQFSVFSFQFAFCDMKEVTLSLQYPI